MSVPSSRELEQYAPTPFPRVVPSGRERRVGLEVELSGLGVAELAAIVAATLGGQTSASDEPTPAMLTVETSFGLFRIELDSDYIKNRRFLDLLERFGVTREDIRAKVEEKAVSIAAVVVPLELVAPPIAWSELHELEPLWREIRTQGGLGTHDALRFAFGLHLNPEVPQPDSVECIVAHIQAFLLLASWLTDVEHVDWSRRVTPYINGFPKEYEQLVLDDDYRPSLDVMIDDYLRFSPTRNRVFDLLPLIAYLRPGFLDGKGIEGAELVSARPTFHYRLPNSDIGCAGWSPASSWANWVQVERLAHDRAWRRRLVEARSRGSIRQAVLEFVAEGNGKDRSGHNASSRNGGSR